MLDSNHLGGGALAGTRELHQPLHDTFHHTTIVAVRHKDRVALAGDGQVTLNNVVMKQGARK